ncbi:BTB/POZ domain-containing protein At1g63850-like isoform X2 [Phoenix dactylifera]|uniref:BTB/POZ domain-containing protein At1g63850-like isoform X2 n=1 Tax=Phoenix dactylifera TaxID=42345 RepID=A0A8B9AUB2_PHODC|nr:BTB/POZ domain-containing protein At1g63850-like isoform X2 [Phoenix dactylifera]
MSLRKRKRVGSSGRLSSSDGTLTEESSPSQPSPPLHPASSLGGFNDPATADVLLLLQPDDPDSFQSLELHLHSAALRRSRYFSALLSDRWHHPDPGGDGIRQLFLKISPAGDLRCPPFDAYVAVLRLLHTLDFAGAIRSVADALEMLPVALELLFDDCVRACVRFLEAVPWTEEEEEGILSVIPFLREEESRDLLARVSPKAAAGDWNCTSEGMLCGLIHSAIHGHPNVATVKAFVAKLLRDYSSRDSVRRVLDQAFLLGLDTVKELLGKYARPDFRMAGDNDEREAIQRLNLHATMVNVKHLHWLVERMIELRVADTAVKEWSEQTALAADLQKTFRDDAWKNIAPGLPTLVARCTCRLANSVASGSTLAPGQMRDCCS